MSSQCKWSGLSHATTTSTLRLIFATDGKRVLANRHLIGEQDKRSAVMAGVSAKGFSVNRNVTTDRCVQKLLSRAF
jgi:hypothetical protein